MRLAGLPWQGYGRAVLAAAIGAAVFRVGQLPLPFLLGPLTASLALTLLGRAPAVPEPLRRLGLAVLGLYAGSAFTAQTVERASAWPLSLAVVLVLTAATTALVALYYGRVAGFDRATRRLAAVPGGLTVVLLSAPEAGADARRLAVVQSLRVLAVVYAGPLLVLALGSDPGAGAAPAPGWPAPAPAAWAWAAAAALAGYALVRLLRGPIPAMLGPLAGMAGLGLAGLPQPPVPAQAMIPVQLFLGTALGTRLAGLEAKAALRAAGHGLVATALTLALALGAALAVSPALAQGPAALFLAFAPGGLPEMVLLASSLSVDPAFVTLHHLVRFVAIAVSAGLLAQLHILGR